MLRKLRPRSVYDVFAVLALFVALGGTSAVALTGSNTVFSDDIANDNFNSPTEGQGGLVAADLRAGSVASSEVANGSLTGTDVFDNTISGVDITNGSLTGADVFDNTIGGADVTNNSLTNEDIQNFSLGNGDFLTGSVDSRVVTDNSLTGTDIDEASLNLPATETRFAGSNPGGVALGPPLDDIASTSSLPAGNYVAFATVNTVPTSGAGDHTTTVFCGLHKNGSFIGGAESKGLNRKSLSMNGGLVVESGSFTTLSVDCNSPTGGVEIARAQLMVMRIRGFF
jgi:hypothetical protein